MDDIMEDEINKYGEEELIRSGIILKEAHEKNKIDSIFNVAMYLCETIEECENCPVVKYSYDIRQDKNNIECCVNLYEWILKQAQDVNDKRLERIRRCPDNNALYEVFDWREN